MRNILLEGEARWAHQTGDLLGISLERYLIRDVFFNSIDISYQGGLFLHYQRITDSDAPFQEPIELSGKNAFQGNVGFKAYWTSFPWNRYVKTRVAVMEGLSYTSSYLDIEMQNVNRKTSKNRSKILNYLEFNMAFHLGDIIRIDDLDGTYIGIGISHRSGIFGLVNGVNGGSNIIFLSIEKEF